MLHVELVPPALKVQSPNHGNPREVPSLCLLLCSNWRYRRWSYPGCCGPVTTGTGSGGRGWWSKPVYCGCVTPGKGSGEKCHPRDCGNVTPGPGLGEINLETLDV